MGWDKYHVLSWEEEQTANSTEQTLLEASIAPAQAETVDLRGYYEGPRKEAWYNSLVKEYEKMKKGVLEETLRSEAHDKLDLPAATPLPREIPSKIVPTLKPADEGQEAEMNSEGYIEKSRLCACGNFENGVDNSGEPWTSSNIPPEIVRCMVSMAVKKLDWTLGGFDVEAAFLNAEISSGDPVLITPPKVMRDLGLIGKDTIWIARRNIYGLRRGPTEWERERDTKCNHAELAANSGDSLGTLTLTPLDLSAGLWKLVSDNRTVGMACCYVDDGLVAGNAEVIRRVIAFFKSQWKIKPTGFLKRKGFTETLHIEETMELKPSQCMRFLGAEILVDDAGLAITQRKYISQELRLRGWLHMKGSESLPTPREGQIPPEEHGGDWEKAKQLSQKECGVLMWIALRSRPDIAACLGIAATQVTTHPAEALKITKGIWRYLRSTWDLVVHYSPHEEEPWQLRIVSDASLAPGGSRSRSGIAIMFGKHLVGWKSQRQALVAWSATEAELDATALAFQDGVKLLATLESILGEKLNVVANGDNAGAIQLLVRERFHVQAMRTRHFAIPCSYVRDIAGSMGIQIVHKSTLELEADGLTKVLGKAKLVKAREQLGLQRPEDMSSHASLSLTGGL